VRTFFVSGGFVLFSVYSTTVSDSAVYCGGFDMELAYVGKIRVQHNVPMSVLSLTKKKQFLNQTIPV